MLFRYFGSIFCQFRYSIVHFLMNSWRFYLFDWVSVQFLSLDKKGTVIWTIFHYSFSLHSFAYEVNPLDLDFFKELHYGGENLRNFCLKKVKKSAKSEDFTSKFTEFIGFTPIFKSDPTILIFSPKIYEKQLTSHSYLANKTNNICGWFFSRRKMWFSLKI